MEVWLYAPKEIMADSGKTEMGIYKRDILRKTERKHAFDQENMLRFNGKKKENTILTKKKRKLPKISTKNQASS